jgi:serine/threonine-protein kinase
MSASAILVIGNTTTLPPGLSEHLEQQGVTLLHSENGEAALNIIAERLPKLVILDMNLPQLDAWELLEAVTKKKLPQAVLFIFVTETPEVHERMRALFIGVKGYWEKNGDEESLQKQIEEILNQSSLATRRIKKSIFQGNLNSVSAYDIFQLIGNYKKNGSLHIKTPTKGVVYFLAGEVVDARWKAREGQAALYRIMTQAEGEFEFIEEKPKCERKIDSTWMVLAMDASRLKDEISQIQNTFNLSAQDFAFMEEVMLQQLIGAEDLRQLLQSTAPGTPLSQALGDAKLLDHSSVTKVQELLQQTEPGKVNPIQQDTSSKSRTTSVSLATPLPSGKTPQHNVGNIATDSTKHMRISHLHRHDSRTRAGHAMVAETILQRLLLAMSLINFEQLNKCMQEQVRLKLQNQEASLHQVLVHLGFVDEETLDKVAHFCSDRGEPLIPGYDVEQLIGEGGLGAVYLAHKSDQPEQQVALKVFAPPTQDASTNVVRFIRECEVAKTLDHPNIIKAYDFGEFFGLYYFVMEYVPGISLERKVIDEGPLNEKEALDICEKILQALTMAWQEGFIHRDIKPSNILIGEDLLKVADFGLAKALSSELEITQGALVGTPFYMSPEQFGGKELDYRTDVYSLGVTLYAILTAHLPFSNTSQMAVGSQHLTAAPPHPSKFNVTVSRPTVAFLFKLLAKEPAVRCQSPEELLDNLRRARNGKMPKGPIPYFYETRKKLVRNVAIPALILLTLAGIGYGVVVTLTHRQAAQRAALAAISLQKADEYLKHGETALTSGDFDTAYRFFSEAHVNYKMAQTQDPKWKDMQSKLGQICAIWLTAASDYCHSEDIAKLDQALKCCEYSVRLKEMSTDTWLELENLKNKTKQKREEMVKKHLETLLKECKECLERGERMLDKGDLESAYAMFAKVINISLALDKEYPSLTMSQDMSFRIGESWLRAVRNVQKENKLAEALQSCRYGQRIKEITFEIKEELRKCEREIEKEIETKSAFAMEADKLWLATSQEKDATARDAFDVQDKIYLHVTLQLENYDAKSLITARCRGDIEETRVSLTAVPSQEQYHWTTLLSCKKKVRGEYKVLLEISCKAIVIAKELTFKLVQLAEDLIFLGKNDKGYEEYSRSKDKMVMVLIPAGEFAMGDPTEEGYVDERPKHMVALDAYLMDKYEVSNAQYAMFLNWWQSTWQQEKTKHDYQLSKEAMQELRYSGNRLPKYWSNQQYNKPELPVVGVTWFDAYAYARWANNITQPRDTSCLPSEAQWEKAAAWHELSTKALIYPFGDQIDAQKANYWQGDRKNTEPVTDHAIGVSPYGLYNMAGNAAEWCDDWYDRKYYSLSPRANPINRKIAKSKVFRGGGFNSKEWEMRSSRRRSFEPHLSNVETGFRCMRWLETR